MVGEGWLGAWGWGLGVLVGDGTELCGGPFRRCPGVPGGSSCGAGERPGARRQAAAEPALAHCLRGGHRGPPASRSVLRPRPHPRAARSLTRPCLPERAPCSPKLGLPWTGLPALTSSASFGQGVHIGWVLDTSSLSPSSPGIPQLTTHAIATTHTEHAHHTHPSS